MITKESEVAQKAAPTEDKFSNKNEITTICYVKDIGLMTSQLTGSVKIYDAFDFKEVWHSNNKNRK